MLGPGIPNPMLFAVNGDPLDEFGKIEYSVRLNAADSPTMKRSAVAGNRRTLVFCAHVKRSEIAAICEIFSGVIVAGTSELQFRFHAAGELALYDGQTSGDLLRTTRLFRDPAAHTQLILAIDTTQAVQSNRGIIIVDGEAAPLAVSALTLNYDTVFNTAGVGNGLGCLHSISGFALGGYLSQPLLIDGYPAGVNQANWSAPLIAALFGRKHSRTNQWRPFSAAAIKPLVDAGGPNSFLVPFTDGSAATAMALGRDASSKGNNFTPANISVAAGVGQDCLEDTPTKNACTFSPPDSSASFTFSNGALRVSMPQNTSASCAPGSITMTEGDWWFEFLVADAAPLAVGVVRGAVAGNGGGFVNSSVLYYRSGEKYVEGVNSAYGASFTTTDVLGMRVNLTAGTATFYKQTGGAGAFAPQGAIALPVSTSGWKICAGNLGTNGGTTATEINCGQRVFNIASQGGVPSGAKALNTKNLKFPAIPKASSASVAVTGTGANIQATLAAARAGWSDYIEIFKRLDAAEGWRWRFAGDIGNYLDTSGTAEKAPFPALPGTSYGGLAIKASAANGVTTGTFVHVTGTASVINDGQSNVRKAVILRRESAGGGNFFTYHPDCAVGKLFYLNAVNGETTDASINSVTAGGFTAASALPSGTYRWMSIAEKEGLIKLGKYSGSTALPFSNCGNAPGIVLAKRIDASGNALLFDHARSPQNPRVNRLFVNLANAQTDGTAGGEILDFVSNGFRPMLNGSDLNAAGGIYAYIEFAASTFRYANAR